MSFAVILLSILFISPLASAAPTRTRSVVVSGPSPFDPGCAPGFPGDATTPPERLFQNAEVEPRVAVDPGDSTHLVGVWQQDRWMFGGAHGLIAGTSFDGGKTWTRSWAPFDHCAGGKAGNGGDFERASDPWVTIAPNGEVYWASLSFDFFGPNNAVAVSKSINGGITWSNPVMVILDTDFRFFNDKESIAADPRDSRFVYAVWDRNVYDDFGNFVDAPVYFSRTTDAGASWEEARSIFDPGLGGGTVANQIVVLPTGVLLDMFVLFPATGPVEIDVIRSSDHGVTWSNPVKVTDLQTVFVFDPETGRYIRTGDVLPDIAVDAHSGKVYVVWQDGRFSDFVHDDIALAASSDGGQTWSRPVQVSQESDDGPSFTASVAVASDGTVGITFYDFRSNTPDPTTLWTDYWLVRCRAACDREDGWSSEIHLAGPFDLRTAPRSGGLFLGDYEGLVPVGTGFLAFFVKTNSGNLDNRTDVIAATIRGEGRHD